MTLRLGKDALGWAQNQSTARTENWKGMCLKFTRMCFNVAAKYPSAEAAYHQTEKRHTSWPPPAGAPVWWTNGRYGHVAISAGDGYCWSSDYKRTGYIDKVPIMSITRNWGQEYRGWTEDINGVVVWTRPEPKTVMDVSAIARAARLRRKVPNGSELKRAVAREVGRGTMNLRSKKLGGGFRRQYKKVQAKYLRAQNERVTPAKADGIPGRRSLTWLGKRQKFKVRP